MWTHGVVNDVTSRTVRFAIKKVNHGLAVLDAIVALNL
jgi:hypothetical protein